MIIKYIKVTFHYSYQISNNRTNPEHLINRKIQSTEHFKTDTQVSLLWPASLCSSPSAFLRIPAEILLPHCVPTHCSFTRTAYYYCRDAPKNTIAPRTFTMWTHLNLSRSAYRRSSPSSALRTDAGLLCLLSLLTQISCFCTAYPGHK